MYDVTLYPGQLDPGDGGTTLLHIVGNCLSVHTVVYVSSITTSRNWSFA